MKLITYFFFNFDPNYKIKIPKIISLIVKNN